MVEVLHIHTVKLKLRISLYVHFCQENLFAKYTHMAQVVHYLFLTCKRDMHYKTTPNYPIKLSKSFSNVIQLTITSFLDL